MKRIRQIIAMLTLAMGVFLLFNPVLLTAQSQPIRLKINGQVITDLPMPPIIQNNSTLVPARAVFQTGLGAEVEWHEGTRAVHIQLYDINISLAIGSNVIIVNGHIMEMPIPAQIINGNTMIPLRAVAENLGFEVDFRERTVFIDTPVNIEPPIEPPVTPSPSPSPTPPPDIPSPTPAPPIDENGDNNDGDDDTGNDWNGEIIDISPNIRYGAGIIRIPQGLGFSLNQATHRNIYRQNQYVLALPVDATQHLGMGTMSISSPLLYSFSIGRNAQGHTYITLIGRQILAVHVYASYAYYHIHVMCPREKYPRIVIIDPGHGGRRPGAVYNNVRAADLNLAVAKKVVQLIEECGYMKVFTTRCADITLDNIDRAYFANGIGDIMVTIHHNAWHNASVSGVETFYLPNEFDTQRSFTSQSLANIMLRQVVAHTGRDDRNARTGNFVVLRYSEIPSALIEVGFMSNPQEFATLITAQYQWRVAQAIYEGLLEAFELYSPER